MKSAPRTKTPPRSTWTLTVGLGLLAILTHEWCLALAFQFDDYWIVPLSEHQLEHAQTVLRHPLEPPVAVFQENHLVDHLYQPVLWAAHRTLHHLGGVPYSPALFHAAGVLVHGLATSLLAALALRLGASPGATLWAGIFFAMHPAASQAVTWVSALGDPLAVFFLLLSGHLLVAPRGGSGPGLARSLGAGAAAALAFGAKVSALGLAALLLPLCLVGRERRWWERSCRALLFLLPLFLLLWHRQAFLGTAEFRYWGGTRASPDTLPAMIAATPRMLGYLFAPWNLTEDVRELLSLAPLPWLGEADPLDRVRIGFGRASLLLLEGIVAVGLFTRRWRALLVCLTLGVAAVGIASFPWSLFVHVRHDNQLGRTLYPIQAAACLCLALAVPALAEPARRRWRVALSSVGVAILTFSLIAHAQNAYLELEAARLVKSRLESLPHKVDDESSPASDRYLVIDDRNHLASIPLTSSTLPLAAAPPFSRIPRPAEVFPDEKIALESSRAFNGHEDEQNLEVAGPQHRLHVVRWEENRHKPSRSFTLPPATPGPLDLRPAPAPSGHRRWEPLHPRALRGNRVLRVHNLRRHEVPRLVRVTVRANRGVFRRELRLREPGVRVLDFDRDWEFMTSSDLHRVEIEGEEEVLEGLGPPAFSKRNEILQLRSPAEGAQYPLGAEVPLAVDFHPAMREEGARALVEVRLLVGALDVPGEIHCDWVPPSNEGEAWGVAWWRAPVEGMQLPELRLEMCKELFEQHCRPFGLAEMSIRFRIYLLDASGQTVARTRLRGVKLVATDPPRKARQERGEGEPYSLTMWVPWVLITGGVIRCFAWCRYRRGGPREE